MQVEKFDGTLSDSGSQEVSLVEYARYHGLTKDFTASHPLSHLSSQSLSVLSLWRCDADALHNVDFLSTDDVEEKWTIDYQSAVFLKETICMNNIELPREGRLSEQARGQYKIEPPLLVTDPELDQRHFVRAQQLKDHATVQPLCRLTDNWHDKDELSLSWPDPDLPAKLLEEVKQEKLQLGKNDIVFLQQCISRQEEPTIEETNAPRRKIKHEELRSTRHTSPLLPLSSPFKPGMPSSSASRMPLATSPIDPLPAEIARVEQTMGSDDEFGLDALSDISMSDFHSIADGQIQSKSKRKRPDDFKVEVPLSPMLEHSSPLKKTKLVTFSDELYTTIPDYAKPFSSDKFKHSDYGYERFLEEVIEPAAQSAMDSVKNEQLSEADSVLRAEVPEIDQTRPPAPWEAFSRRQRGCETELEAQRQMISMLRREIIKSDETWPGISKMSKALMRWKPFKFKVSDLPDEDIDMEVTKQFEITMPDNTTSDWKTAGLRILDPREDDDEELELADIQVVAESTDLETIASKLDHFNKSTQGAHVAKHSAVPVKITESGELQSTELHVPGKNNVSEIPLVASFSASSSLDRFMQIHTGKRASLVPTNQTKPNTAVISKNLSGFDNQTVPDTKNGLESMDDNGQTTMHLPTLPTPMPRRIFVLSATMFERKALVQKLESLNPSHEYIERDFTSGRALHGLASLTSETDEADIILAPGCGLLLTTLQKIKQRSLPGQVSRNLVREHVLKVARRYEHLVVMVHEDKRTKAGTVAQQQRPLDTRDCVELASLIDFCAGQSHDIHVVYVPGDESSLATWITASMVRFGIGDAKLRLLQDETNWELFLRKAGMDAFAAQMVLTDLKRPDPMPNHMEKKDYGLPGFVMMSEADRLRRFSALIGGEKILKKVSMAIDGEWRARIASSKKVI